MNIDLSLLQNSIQLDHKVSDITIQKGTHNFIIKKEDKCRYILNPIANKNTDNIFVYICRGGNHVHYFEDYMNSLNIADIEIQWLDVRDLTLIDFNVNVKFLIMYDWAVDLRFLNYTPKNTFIINLEQMSHHQRYMQVRKYYDEGFPIIDYTKAHRYIFPKEIYFPYQCVNKEIDKLKSFHLSTEYNSYEYDICMIPCNSKERQFIFDELVKKGIKITSIEGWGDERDKKIAQCKIILNLHFNSTFQIYEHLRCDRWMFANKIIISEYSQQEEILDVNNVYFYEYEDIIDACIKHLSEFDSGETKIKSVEDIIEERNKYRNDFIGTYDK